MTDQSNPDEGANPAGDIKAQNPEERTTGDQTDPGKTKTQDLAKAGREEMDPNEGNE